MAAPQVCKKFLPRQILKRKKRGFGVNVVDEWLQSSAKGKFTDALLDESSLMYGVLNPAPVKKLLADHQSRRQDNHKLLFSLIMFEQWLRGVR